ncbi:MAG: Sel1 repeat [Rickettsiaceae bacterium]|jgi:hypothetical protein|nr:Sel1 repeat [Rickettsiaceae bacterium]
MKTKEQIDDLIEAAKQGDAVAQFDLAKMYYGRGVAQDLTEAVKWYTEAAIPHQKKPLRINSWKIYQNQDKSIFLCRCCTGY